MFCAVLSDTASLVSLCIAPHAIHALPLSYCLLCFRPAIATSKSGLPTPTSAKAKVMNAVALLDSVTVPPGQQPATDSGAGEGAGDHTIFAVVYERGVVSDSSGGGNNNATMYWRTDADQSLQRLVLSDLDLGSDGGSDPPAEVRFLSVANDLPWFTDAASSFQP